MTPDTVAYTPISCDFHDLLEAAAARRVIVRLEIRHTADVCTPVEARIVDLVTRTDGEYMVLDSGASVRLDHIVSIDGERRLDDPA